MLIILSTLSNAVKNDPQNKYGVFKTGLSYSFRKEPISITLKASRLNGMWHGGLDIMSKSGFGCGSPVMKNDGPFSSLEECAEYLWNHAEAYLKGNVKEFDVFKKMRNKWDSLTSEQKRNCFVETIFHED